jgi:hypothetical protein
VYTLRHVYETISQYNIYNITSLLTVSFNMPIYIKGHSGQALQSQPIPLARVLIQHTRKLQRWREREEQNKQDSIINIAYIKYEYWHKCEMYVLRQKLTCVPTHIVNFSDNGAGRSDECVRALKYQMLPAARDGLLRHVC